MVLSRRTVLVRCCLEEENNMENIQTRLVKALTEKGQHIAAAESLTGGMISEMITAVPGASGVIELGICSYSNRIKNCILGVPQEILDEFTEYSSETACAMAEGVRKLSGADIAVSATGIAGPGGALPGKPVGSVWIGVSTQEGTRAKEYHFEGSRDEVRRQAAEAALVLALSAAG